MRAGNMTGMAMSSGDVTNSDYMKRYNEGYYQAMDGYPLKGHHTAAFAAGYNAGQIALATQLKTTNPSQ